MASFDVVSLPAFHQACRDGDSTTVGVLINATAMDRLDLFHRICECDSYMGWTPAHWAAYHGRVECFRRLLACGLNVDIGECRYKRSPAHVSAFAGHPHMLLCLLQAGADPNKQDENGDTVVHHAARSGSNDCLAILQSHNAYMWLKFHEPIRCAATIYLCRNRWSLMNKEGQTPLNVASMCGYEHSVEYLSQFQSQQFYSGGKKRGLDEDEINRDVKRICNGSSWKMQTNGIGHHTMELLNGHPHADKPAPVMQVETEINGNHYENVDNDMEDLCEDAKPMSAVYFEKHPTKLSIPQRCMGSHFM